MNKIGFISGWSICCFLMIGMHVSCSSRTENKENANVRVKVQKIGYSNTVYTREYVGTVESENSVNISFLTMGNIEQMTVQEGEFVKKGQLLAKLNANSAENLHDIAMATLNRARDGYDRLSTLHENKSLPEVQYVEVKTALEQAESAEKIARKNLEDCNLYAPSSGVVGKRYVETGANIMPGIPVYLLMNINPVKVKIAIPESEISSVRIGEKSQIEVTALNNRRYEGRVIEKGVTAHPISHTYDIKVHIENKDHQLLPGMVCKAYLTNDGGSENGPGKKIVVPLKSVQLDHSGKHFVWLIDKDGKAFHREVTIGGFSGNGVTVTGGLHKGDILVTEGYQNVSPGTIVEVVK
ncbi:MAG: efflux RND transporter periplasmic adaptor subunit [Porphyromonadaceae bacterium]|nr:efflux RND transporter periplasmic adaptor subunit [Porphyromonadaceae bacterium]